MQEKTVEPLAEFELVVEETGSLVVTEPTKRALVEKLRPIAQRLVGYQIKAEQITVQTQPEADIASTVMAEIDRDVKAVDEALDDILRAHYNAHRRWTGFKGLFTSMVGYRKKIKDKVATFEDNKRKAAEEVTRRLQAAEEERVRKEQQRLEQQAARAEVAGKTEMAEALREEADNKVAAAPVVPVQRTAGFRGQKRWKVAKYPDGTPKIDLAKLVAFAAKDGSALGYFLPAIEDIANALSKAKQANKLLVVEGVEFTEVNQ